MSVEASGPRIVVGQLLPSVMIIDKSLALIELWNHRLLLPVQYDIRTCNSLPIPGGSGRCTTARTTGPAARGRGREGDAGWCGRVCGGPNLYSYIPSWS